MQAPGRLRTYRALLRLFPRDFRELRGAELERLFLEMCAEWEEEGRRLGFRFWSSLVWDTSKEALGEWSSLSSDAIGSTLTHSLGEHMSAVIGDIRFAFRQLVRQPLYSAMIVTLMALGIAGNTAVFRVFNGLFLRPLPFDNPEQLVDLDETAPQWDVEYLSVAYRDFAAWRDNNSTFQSMMVYDRGGGNFVGEGEAQRVTFLTATHTIDEVLGLEPILGRFFGPEEDHPDGPRAMLISQGFWEQEYGSDPSVLGRTVTVNGFPIEIIGVLPPEARFMADVDMWMPLRQVETNFSGWGLNGIGRLNPDATIEQARANLMTIHKGLIDQWEVNEISSPVINSLRDRYLGDYRLGGRFLLGAVGIVLLIACANIAGLMSARSISRSSEMAVRLAMGCATPTNSQAVTDREHGPGIDRCGGWSRPGCLGVQRADRAVGGPVPELHQLRSRRRIPGLHRDRHDRSRVALRAHARVAGLGYANLGGRGRGESLYGIEPPTSGDELPGDRRGGVGVGAAGGRWTQHARRDPAGSDRSGIRRRRRRVLFADPSVRALPRRSGTPRVRG